jgi:hypothetical protein
MLRDQTRIADFSQTKMTSYYLNEIAPITIHNRHKDHMQSLESTLNSIKISEVTTSTGLFATQRNDINFNSGHNSLAVLQSLSLPQSAASIEIAQDSPGDVFFKEPIYSGVNVQMEKDISVTKALSRSTRLIKRCTLNDFWEETIFEGASNSQDDLKTSCTESSVKGNIWLSDNNLSVQTNHTRNPKRVRFEINEDKSDAIHTEQ